MTANTAKKILFVCTGNICRSPIAQFLAERLAREAGLPWRAASAGVAAEVDWGMEPGAINALKNRGITGASHSARQIDEEMMADSDAIYALTRSHRATIVSRFPQHAAKVAVLREAAGLPGADVSDPYGENDAVYEACAARIEEALTILIRRSPHAQNAR